MSIAPTLVVAITDVQWISNLLKAYSAPIYHKGYRVILHGDPKTYHSDYGELPANYDILIKSGTSEWYKHKAEQSAYLHGLGIRVPKFSGQFPVTSQQQNLFIDPNGYFASMWSSPTEGQRYLIKSTVGARGIGQCLVDSKISVIQVLAAIKEFKREERGEDEPLSKFLLDKFNGGVIYNTAGEWQVNEGLSQMDDLYLQEYLDIEEEYRVITDSNGLVDYIQTRNRVGDVYKQAIGSNALDGIDRTVVNPRWQGVRDFIFNEVVGKGAVMPFSSMDIVLTKDGKLYLLEYSAQFGIEGIPIDDSYRLAKSRLEYEVDQWLLNRRL